MAVDLAVELLTNPVRHRAMRSAAVRRAGRFSVEQGVHAYEMLYQNQRIEKAKFHAAV